VKSLDDHRPLSYATVVNLTRNKIFSSDENGLVSANFEIGDSIVVSYIGFQNSRGKINLPGNLTYFLKPLNKFLDPVKIISCKNVETHEYSNLAADTTERKFGGVSWFKSAINAKVAVMLKPGFEDAALHSFSIWLRRGMGTPKSAMKAPLVFSFYNIDDSSLLPGELISNQKVIFYPKKEGRQTIGVDSLHIRIPKAGIYVCMEYVYDEKYQYPMRHIDKEKGIDTLIYAYAGLIDGVFSKDYTLSFYSYLNDSWFFPMKRDKSYVFRERHGTIRFSATLTTCREMVK
jgi:hypothetical protein